MKTVVLKRFQQTGEGGDGGRMDVVKEQNALTTFFQPPHRQSHDLLAIDAVMPIVGVGV